MKKLITICLIMATAYTVSAQNRNSTKEQTVAYLKSLILNVEGGQIIPLNGRGRLSCLYEMELDGYILKVKCQHKEFTHAYNIKNNSWEKSQLEPQEIDFTQIKSFRLKKMKFPCYIFKDYNENLLLHYTTKKFKKGYIVGFYCLPENSKKVLKSLNHLRKLCKNG